ncbi:1,3-beta-glucan synthase component-domain-containing protein [Mycotypha africana]|uniref:1,3-beta-glucan synthase component-domain-containing protein n=1 Tax=Mycotypha africana TaxID=64632 RepID=UPI002301EB04|nr:1,3-beta-glucan synthase component-domain-containing protein [Mycotypha africana]KAI8967273.1 1,3-beta-glucan synthase component-domain-containing protein [Mycotypha africana]
MSTEEEENIPNRSPEMLATANNSFVEDPNKVAAAVVDEADFHDAPSSSPTMMPTDISQTPLEDNRVADEQQPISSRPTNPSTSAVTLPKEEFAEIRAYFANIESDAGPVEAVVNDTIEIKPSTSSEPADAPTRSILPQLTASEGQIMMEGKKARRPSSRATLESFSTSDVLDVDVSATVLETDDSRYMTYASSAEDMLALLEARKYSNQIQMKNTMAQSSGASSVRSSILVDKKNRASAAFLAPELINPLEGYTSTTTEPADYPAWGPHDCLPVTLEEIDAVFNDMAHTFGFQRDNIRNMSEHLKVMLDSRASRLAPQIALDTLHAEYIGGEHANYRKWYFAAEMDVYDATEEEKARTAYATQGLKWTEQMQLKRAQAQWDECMRQLTNMEKLQHLALYLCIWGEAGPLRYTPEALCFLFKVASDHYFYLKRAPADEEDPNASAAMPEGAFLDTLITPFYHFFRDQMYKVHNGKYLKRERDHDKVIGYDDVNQFFWHFTCLDRIRLPAAQQQDTKTKSARQQQSSIGQLPAHQRYAALKDVDWKNTFEKTYKEKRSWMHASINFARVWVIHIVTFWYYIMANAYPLYLHPDPEMAEKEKPVQISMVALGGVVACLLFIIGSCAELAYIPFTWRNAKCVLRRMGFLVLLAVINGGPTYYCVYMNRTSRMSLLTSVAQLLVSVATTLYLAVVPSARLFMRKSMVTRAELANEHFTASFPSLKRIDRIMSICLWVCVFGCKLLESYFFLALSFKDPLKVISSMTITHCHKDAIVGLLICEHMPRITIVLMLIMDMVLYFLDTYLWYVIWNTIFSVARSFYLGISIWSPWRNIFARLPQRIHVKLLATNDIPLKVKPKLLCSQIWNAIVVTMYREHLISVDHLQRMLYQQEVDALHGQRTLKTPAFFVSQEDTSFKTECFPQNGEADRRIRFFAQSLTTPMPQPHPVECMPTFTVLTPHYGEKILLSLREIIKEEDNSTRITLLEYLKKLHGVEWHHFVQDTKMLAHGSEEAIRLGAIIDNNDGEQEGEKNEAAVHIGDIGGHRRTDSQVSAASTVLTAATLYSRKEETAKNDDVPFYCIGFKHDKPEFTLRTRIWSSLRAQTLYRTVSGFMNYKRAIQILFRVERPDIVKLYEDDKKKLNRDLNRLAHRKFRFLVAMQRYAKFSPAEAEDAELLLKAFPQLQIAYIDEEEGEGGETIYYSCLIDGLCDYVEGSHGLKRQPRFRIRLAGNPILGDGKSDNQNHAIVFYRGEFLQLVDANQDNYLEECLKIRNVLSEFENLEPTSTSPYSTHYEKSNKAPVAIVGAREYIFSENIGVLGDVAAGKEQTFGTLTQRIMAKIGGKLHYGHPDFLNAIFMTTRGGVSKAQKGLHLNEDIYAGMNAFTRGGRIKHTEYFQCGKGRDLGFGSILNFTTKIGTGMGEQMLSREYYYIGTQLPLDRFLTFYYAHPGFHINNIFIMKSVQLFMLVILFVTAMATSLTICEYNQDAPDAPLTPEGCYNLIPIIEWVKRCIMSIFVVFFAAFLPLFLQELTERGFWRSLTRMARHFMSLSPLFEIFVTQIYTHSVLENLIYGGAQYIGTGRGFATSRLSFALLYSRFTGPSIYVGARNLIIMLFASLAYWLPHLIYFWLTVVALIVSPFVFNPNQFSRLDFLIDYKEFIRWLSRGNSKPHAHSWISHTRAGRARITGYKRYAKAGTGAAATTVRGDTPRASHAAIFVSEILFPLFYAMLCTIPYIFVKSFDTEEGATTQQQQQGRTATTGAQPSPLIRIGVLSFAPLLLNALGLLMFFGVSIGVGSIVSLWSSKFGSVIAATTHAWSVMGLMVIFEVLFVLENWKLTHVVLAMVAMVSIQRFVLRVLTILCLTRELKQDEANRAWWTGKWYGRGLGWHVITQPGREFVCKMIEMSEFSTDFILGHIILFFLSVFLLVPYIDTLHSLMLFWLRPSKQFHAPIWTASQKRKRMRVAICYGILFYSLFLIFACLVIGPLMVGQPILSKMIPKSLRTAI